jgi:adhesin/invasin
LRYKLHFTNRKNLLPSRFYFEATLYSDKTNRLVLRSRSIFLVLLMAIAGSCTDQGTGPDALRSARVVLNPQFVVTPGSTASTLPITRIRLTARDAVTNAVLEAVTVAVDPDAEEWEIDFSVRITAATRAIVTIELIHVSGTGVETVEWSGVTAELTLTPGVAAEEDLSVLPGPLDNLQVTAISISDVPTALLEGDGARLRAVVTAPAGVTPRVFWATSDTAVLRVDEDGDVTGVRPGTAQITAQAGTRSATVDITVGARAVTLTIDPATAALDQIGAEMTFTANVLDARGAPVPDSPVTWSVTNADVLQHLGAGRFRALRAGSTTIQAVLTSAPTITSNAIVTVTQRVTRIVVTPPVSSLDARGATVQLSAAAEDAGGAAIPLPMLTWSSSDEAVATVDQTGLVTAVGDGVATIRAASGEVNGAAEIRVARRAALLAIVEGNAQTAAAGSELPVDPAVRVTDATGNPMAGVGVVFTIASGGGSITGGSAVTDASGVAAVGSWTLGTTTGSNALNAAVEGLAPVTFTATATSGAPAVVAVHAGNNQTATVGTAVTIPPAVRVLDAFSNPVAGVTVTFAVVSGAGQLTNAIASTDANGVAAVGSWTLGPVAGANELSATVESLTPVTFTATGTTGSPATVVIHAGNDQTATVGTAVTTAPAIRVTDASGNPLANVGVVFSIRLGGGQVTGASTATDAAGVATVGSWTLGTAPGVNQLDATVDTLAPVTFNATATVGAPATVAIHAGNGQSAPAGSAVPVPPAARVTDAHGNPVAGVTVTFAIVSGGGQVTDATPVSDANGVAAVASWTLGPDVGTNELSATVEGLTPVTFTAAGTSGAPAILMIHGGNDQTATVGTAVTSPTVLVMDATENPLAGITVVFAVVTGGGQITGDTALTNASGVAAVGSWTLGTTPGANQLSATVDGLDPVTFNATATVGPPASITSHAGDGQSAPAGSAVAVPPAARVTDAHGNPVAGVTVLFTIVSGAGQVTGESAVTDANGVAAVGSWTLGTSGGTNQLRATVEGVGSVEFTATATTATPSISLALADGHTNVGASFTAPLRITLSAPAPLGGVSVTIVSSNTAKLRVASPGAVTIPSGATEGTIQLEGVEAGSATLTATATGHTQAVLAVTVSLRLISLPLTLNVPYGQTASLPIQLAEPAPAGGVVVTIASSDEARVHVLTPTVTIAEGATLASATVEGTLPGSANVTATATEFIGATSTVTTRANLDVLQSYLQLNASFGNSFTLRLQSAGQAIAAPAGGVQVSFAAVSPLCVSVPANATIPQGLTQITVPVTYNDATLPCTTYVRATADNILPDSVSVYVEPTPVISFSASTVGAGLQRYNTVYLSTSNHDGVTVRITSADSTRLLLARDANTVGAASVDVSIPVGYNAATFYTQAVGPIDTVDITATADRITSGTVAIPIVQPALELIGVPTSMTTLTADDPFQVRIGVPYGTIGLSEIQALRAGATSLVVTVQSDTAAVATLVTSSGTAATDTVEISAGLYFSPGSVATGGVALHPLGAGTTVVRATAPGFLTTAGAARTVVVDAPVITMTNSTTGAGLMRYQTATLSVSTHGGVDVRVRSTDASRMLISADANTAGTEYIDVSLLNGTQSFSFYTHAIEGVTDTVMVTASSRTFTTGTANVAIVAPALDISGVPGSMTTTTPDDAFTARVGIPYANNAYLYELQSVRFGGTGFQVTFTSSEDSIASLVTSSDTSDTVVLSLVSGNSTPFSVATGGVALRAESVGTVTISATAPGTIATTGASHSVAITGSPISLSPSTVGSGLQRAQNGNLGGTDHGGVTVRVSSTEPDRLLIAPDANTAGSAFIDIAVPNGSSYFQYYTQALDGLTDTVTVSVTAPGFNDASSTVAIVQPAVDMSNLNTNTNTLAGDDPFTVQVGIPNSGSFQYLTEYQNRRVGGEPLVVTVTSSTTAGQIITDSTAGGSGTTTVVANTYRSPFSLATGGIGFRPFSAGTTVVSATIPGFRVIPASSQTVTVSAPAITLYPVTVGAGLQNSTSGYLSASNHGGRTIRLATSNSSVALLSPNATTAGTPTIDVIVPNGQTGFTFYVHGIEGAAATVAISATTDGFTDGSATATVVQPGVEIFSLNTTTSVITAPDQFTVGVGIPNSTNAYLNQFQSVRAGAQPLVVTVTTSNAGHVRLATSTESGASVTLAIPAGSYQTGGSLATGGVQIEPLFQGTATIDASIPGYIRSSATRTVIVDPARITVSSSTVGAGLQRFSSMSFNGGNHGGITVRLTSADGAKLWVATSSGQPGAPTADIVVPNGATSISFAVQGLENVTGDVIVEASVPEFESGFGTMSVVQPAFDIAGITTPTTSTALDDVFTVRVGLPNSLNTGLNELQSVRPGSSGLSVTLTSSNAAVGQLVTSQSSGGTVTAVIGPNANTTAGTVASGGVAFDPLTAGSTTVTSAINGLRALPGATVNVTVN